MRTQSLLRLFVLSLFFVTTLFFVRTAEMKTEPMTNLRFSISFPDASSHDALDGRMLLLVSNDNTKEPRFQINEDLNTQQVFAVYLVDDFLKSTKDPYYGGEVDYEPRAEHCWNGDHTQPNAISRLRYHQFYAPKIVDRILKTAPKGADLTSWRY